MIAEPKSPKNIPLLDEKLLKILDYNPYRKKKPIDLKKMEQILNSIIS